MSGPRKKKPPLTSFEYNEWCRKLKAEQQLRKAIPILIILLIVLLILINQN